MPCLPTKKGYMISLQGGLYPECRVANTTVMGKVGEVEFKATGKQVLDPGWRVLYANDKKEEKEEEEKVMPVFEAGETGPHEPRIHHGKTSPPKYYTEATLLRAMETAGRQVEDEEMREVLKDNGIGRPSTRANIIETLYKRKYIEKKKKNIIATQTGIDLIDTIQIELLKSAELTGQWERKLRLIEKGEYALDTFKAELTQMVTDLVSEVKTGVFRVITIADPREKPADKPARKPREKKEATDILSLPCPKCGETSLLKGKTAYGCRNFQACGFKIPFEIFGKKLTEAQVADLLTRRKTGKLKGWQSPEGKAMEGKLALSDSFDLSIE
jgi:DNA topoisomerase-3